MAEDSLLIPALRSDATMQAIESLTRRLLDQRVPAVVVMDIDNLPPSAIQHMAEQLSILDEPAWELAETDAARRNLLKRAFELHRFKGTSYAVRLVFSMLGLGDVQILEGRGGKYRDGTYIRNGFIVRADASEQWAVYRVICSRLLTLKHAAVARRMLAYIAPARCALFDIDFSGAALIRNGYATRNGTYSRGSA